MRRFLGGNRRRFRECRGFTHKKRSLKNRALPRPRPPSAFGKWGRQTGGRRRLFSVVPLSSSTFKRYRSSSVPSGSERHFQRMTLSREAVFSAMCCFIFTALLFPSLPIPLYFGPRLLHFKVIGKQRTLPVPLNLLLLCRQSSLLLSTRVGCSDSHPTLFVVSP